MIRKIEEYCKRNNLIDMGDKIVIGLSGGADSVCLFFVLSDLKETYHLNLQVIHIHHGIRGAEADRDAAFVQALCENYQIPCLTEYYDIGKMAKEQRQSVEEVGRFVRYAAMERLRRELGFTKIAVAHHSGDQAETILFHLCRGSGLAGLRGMQPVSERIIRPLLLVSRQEIEAFLRERKQEWCMDSTNLENNYSRNILRNQVLPLLTTQINSEAVEHIAAVGEILGEAYAYIQKEAKEWADRWTVERGNGEWAVSTEKLVLAAPVIRKEIYRILLEKQGGLRDISMVHLEQIEDLLLGKVGRSVDLPKKRKVVREYHTLLFLQKDFVAEQTKSVEMDWNGIDLVPGRQYLLSSDVVLSVEMLEEIDWFCQKNGIKREKIMEENPCTKCFDYDTIKDTLKLRTREAGDYLELGAGLGTKTLKKYFIEKKIPREERGRIPLIADGSHILWIIGYRISAGYKVTDTTRTILQIKISGGQEDGR